MTILLSAAALAASGTLIFMLLLSQRAESLGLLDLPNERSSHRAPTPRVGGAAIASGWILGILCLLPFGVRLDPSTWLVIGLSIVVAAIGFLDDLRTLTVKLRLGVQVAAAAALVLFLGGLEHIPLPAPVDLKAPAVAGTVLAMLWLVGVTNFFNFMDGLDGLASGQAIVVSCTLAVAASIRGGESDRLVLSVLLIGPLLVFWFFNRAPARAFLGDGGSYLLGFFFAAMPWVGPREVTEETLFLVAASLGLFLLDPAWTLWLRGRRGVPLGKAHREHLYQKVATLLGSHSVVSTAHHVSALVVSFLAVAGCFDPQVSWLALATLAVVFLAEGFLVHRLTQRSGQTDDADPSIADRS